MTKKTLFFICGILEGFDLTMALAFLWWNMKNFQSLWLWLTTPSSIYPQSSGQNERRFIQYHPENQQYNHWLHRSSISAAHEPKINNARQAVAVMSFLLLLLYKIRCTEGSVCIYSNNKRQLSKNTSPTIRAQKLISFFAY